MPNAVCDLKMGKKTSVSEFFLRPPLWLDIAVWSITAILLGASVAFLCLDIRGAAWSVAVYVAALILLVLSVYLVLTFRDIPQRVVKNRHIKRFVADFGFRSYVMTVCAALVNFLYAVFGTVIAVLNRSVWLGALVWYRIVVVAARALSVIAVGRHAHRSDFEQYKTRIYLYIGVMMNILALATVPVVLLVVWQQNSYDFFGVAIVYTVALAVYSFFKLALSFNNSRRAHKDGDMAVAATRNIGVCDALISVFALQATLFAVYDAGTVAVVLNPLTGGLVAGAIFIIGVYMITRAAVLLKRGAYRARLSAMAELSEDSAYPDGDDQDAEG